MSIRNTPVITLEQFRATRREVPDLAAELDGDTSGDLTGQRGLVYAGDVYMTITEDRHIALVLNGWDWYREESDLPMLEELLYGWAVMSGALDSVG